MSLVMKLVKKNPIVETITDSVGGKSVMKSARRRKKRFQPVLAFNIGNLRQQRRHRRKVRARAHRHVDHDRRRLRLAIATL
jgi:hypothetical protein